MTRHDAEPSTGATPFWRHGLRLFLVLAINVLLIAVAAELGARLFYPAVRGDGFTWADARARLHSEFSMDDIARGDRTRDAGFSQGETLHPYLGWVMDPSATIVQNGTEKKPYSRLGFLGGDLSAEPIEGEYVIGISGGSVAGGFWLEGSRELREALRADPRFSGKRIRIENFALAGYKQPQALLTLTYLLVRGGHFDLWINLDGFNEVVLPVTENFPAHVAPAYPRSWQLLAQQADAPGELQWRAGRYAAIDRRERWRRVADSPVSHSAFVVAAWDAIDRRHERAIRALNDRYRAHEAKAEASAAVQGSAFGQPPPDTDEVMRQSVEIWMNSSIQMARLCEANGIAYFHFLQPNQYLAGSKPFSEEEQRIAFAMGGYRPAAEKGYPLLIEAVKELRTQGVAITDLTPMFQDEPRTIYRDSCCHVNELGNRLIAAQVAETILGSSLL